MSRVFVIGATGYIGSAASEALAASGREVVGVARSAESARALEVAGHGIFRGDLGDPDSLVEGLREADAVVYAAQAEGEDGPRIDARAVEVILDTLEGTAKPFVYTSGVWVLGDTAEVTATEDFDARPVELVRWRLAVESRVLEGAGQDVAAVVVRPALVYGRGGGIPALLVEEARSGEVRVVGDGRQLWPMVHVDDLADLYVRLLATEPGRLYHAASGPSYAARDLALVALRGAGTDGKVVEWPLEEAVREVGGFAEALALSQRVSGGRARRETGWRPRSPTPIEELLRGSYTTGG